MIMSFATCTDCTWLDFHLKYFILVMITKFQYVFEA